MLQSRVEIEHYSIAYFDTLLRLKRCSSELPLRAELIPATYTYQVFMSLGCAYEPPPPPLMEVQAYSALNVVMQLKYTTVQFLPGLPHT